ncbi:PIN domain-containing protein [Nostoc sp. MG11]|uniref:PIN domain-containing protein n=1 Tax=Nostoc sp. MG11 TaxID=2721166 RepID=UPI0029FF0EA3|nr:PIN domain-containing protein [Nostoc sp. MG11]
MILYVETNFLMSIAKGQDELAENFLQNTPTSVCLVIPSICYVESLATLEQEDKYNQDFIRRLDIQVNEAGMDKTSQNAKLVVNYLQKANLSFLEHNNDIEKRFYIAFNQLVSKAEEIPLTTEIIHGSLDKNILKKHLMDKLILECIVHHARLHPNEIKVFLSSNSKEFGRREVIEVLRDTGIQYFNKTQKFLGWLQSQSN